MLLTLKFYITKHLSVTACDSQTDEEAKGNEDAETKHSELVVSDGKTLEVVA